MNLNKNMIMNPNLQIIAFKWKYKMIRYFHQVIKFKYLNKIIYIVQHFKLMKKKILVTNL